jgi:preprotein translocase subunit SecB
MDETNQLILKFLGTDIVKVNVSLKNPFNHDEHPPVEISIKPKVFYPDDNLEQFTIIIDLDVTSRDYFTISIVSFGRFSLNKPVSEPGSKLFIDVNAPAIMFPYVRAFLSTLTANLGRSFPPIILPPHFFQGELEEHTENVEPDR